MPQNQRRASGLAIVIAAMSSSSPGRIGVSMATTSRPAGSRMKPDDARPTQVACVQSTREAAVLYYAVVQGHVDGVEGNTKEKVDFRAAQRAICSTSSPPPRTASPLAAPLGVERAAAPEMRAKARSCIFMAVYDVFCAIFPRARILASVLLDLRSGR